MGLGRFRLETMIDANAGYKLAYLVGSSASEDCLNQDLRD